MAKPAGPACNLACAYCFYLEKQHAFPSGTQFRMPPDVLEAFVRQYIESQDTPEVNFAWQGGEPTLLGVPFFREAFALQQKYANGKRISNSMQTNGVLLDDAWGEFLHAHNVLIGISIDGPRELHDHYRRFREGRGSFDAVMHGLETLRKHKVEFNTLTVVNAVNAREPLKVYRFLKDAGVTFLQFIPLVERAATADERDDGQALAGPPRLRSRREQRDVPEFCVSGPAYGRFLCAVFDAWVRQDVGRIYVQLFDVTLGNWVDAGPGLCVSSQYCGNAVIIEHNGDVYSCDHFMYPAFRLGNVLTHDVRAMVESAFQRKFGRDKFDALPDECRDCSFLRLCYGGCPKHRFLRTRSGQAGLNYLCAGYKKFFAHTKPAMNVMADLLRRRQPPAQIMELLARQDAAGGQSRNAPCPCGSGKKYKHCCGTQHADR